MSILSFISLFFCLLCFSCFPHLFNHPLSLRHPLCGNGPLPRHDGGGGEGQEEVSDVLCVDTWGVPDRVRDSLLRIFPLEDMKMRGRQGFTADYYRLEY